MFSKSNTQYIKRDRLTIANQVFGSAPIDGGLGLLAPAGGAYAVKKLREKRSEEEELE